MISFDASVFFPAFILPLVAVWVWASLLSVGALLLFTFAVLAIRRAVRSSRELPDGDVSNSSLLGIVNGEKESRGFERSDPADLLPAVQTPIFEPPAPEPLIPVESFAKVHAEKSVASVSVVAGPEATTEKILETSDLSYEPHRAALKATQEDVVLETDDLDGVGRSSPLESPAAVSPQGQEALIAQQIAQQIAERRARLAASADEAAGESARAAGIVQSVEADKTDDEGTESRAARAVVSHRIPARLTSPSPFSDDTGVPTNGLSSKTAPATLKSPFTEQLPSSGRKKLTPPAASAGSPIISSPPIERFVGRDIESPVIVPLTERIEPVSPPDDLIPVEQFPAVTTPMTDPLPPPRGQGRQAVPSFLGEGVKPSVTEIGFERGRILIGMGVVGVLFMLTAVIISPLRQKLPPAIAEPLAVIPRKLGLEGSPPPLNPPKQVQVQEYQNGFKPGPKKEVRVVVISGLVKNITSEKLTDLRAELELLPRKSEGGGAPETRVIYLNPPNLEPNQEGKYEIEIMDDQYRASSFKRIKSADGREIPMNLVKDPLPTPFPEEKTRPKR